MLTADQKDFYWKNGYLVIPKLFTAEEVKKLKEGCKKRPVGDTAGNPDFDNVTLSPRVIEVVKDILGDNVIYPGLSLTRTDDHPKPFGTRRLHTDTVAEHGDFDIDYPILNMGLYLQDQTNWSGALKVIPGSQHRVCILIRTISDGLKKVLKALLRGDINTALQVFDFHTSVNIESVAGDMIIWSMRTHHSGYGVRLKGFKKLSLHPVLENWIPSFLRIPDNPDRDVILTVYAAPGKHFEEYMQVQARKLHRKAHFLGSKLGTEEVKEAARAVGVTLRNDGYEFATNPTSVFSDRGDYY